VQTAHLKSEHRSLTIRKAEMGWGGCEYCLTEAGLNVARELRASEELEENNSSTPKATAPQTGEAVVEENDGSSLGSENSGSSPANKC
ncbi:hypothetical protein E2320_013819, partial [Naja naja]